MPRKANFRQRGKKKKGNNKEGGGAATAEAVQQPPHHLEEESANDGASEGAEQLDHAGEYDETTQHAQANGEEQTAWDAVAAAYGGRNEAEQPFDVSAPFGLVDPDVKAYFRNVHGTLRSIAAAGADGDDEGREEEDAGLGHSKAEIAALRDAALEEMSGKELTLATDADTSLVIEELLRQMSEKQVRVLTDRFSGNLYTLATHRFGSHVLQACLEKLQRGVAEDVRQESKGKSKAGRAAGQDQAEGTLRSAPQLVVDMVDELLPAMRTMPQHPFATHVVRALLVVLSGQAWLGSRIKGASLRSKRSEAFRAKGREGLEGLQVGLDEAGKPTETPLVPAAFDAKMEQLESAVLGDITAMEIKAMSISSVASPTLQMLLEVSRDPKMLLNLILDGLYDKAHNEAAEGKSASTGASEDERSAHVEALLRDTVGSHTLEQAISLSPSVVVARFWRVYVKGRLIKLGQHPVANFAVSKALKRLPARKFGEENIEGGSVKEDWLLSAASEIKSDGPKLVKAGKAGLLQALLERCAATSLHNPAPDPLAPPSKKKKLPPSDEYEAAAVTAVVTSFGLGKLAEEEKDRMLVPVVLSLRSRKGYEKQQRKARTRGKKGGKDKKRKRGEAEEGDDAEEDDDQEEEEQDEGLEEPEEQAAKGEGQGEGETPAVATAGDGKGELASWQATMQGSVLLQTLSRMSAPHNEVVYKSLLAQPSLLPLARNPVALHVLTTALQSGSATFKQRKDLIGRLGQDLHMLADEAPRVAYTVWERSDGYTKEKLAHFLQSRDRFLQGSSRGRAFLRKVNLGLLRKGVGEWKRWIVEQGASVPGLLDKLGADEEKRDVERRQKDEERRKRAAEEERMAEGELHPQAKKAKKSRGPRTDANVSEAVEEIFGEA